MTTKKFSRTRVDLQERDLDILETIAELRFATVQQISKLFPSTENKIINPKGEFRKGAKAIANRLAKMAQRKHRYIKRIGYPHRLGSEPSVYTLEEKGVRMLARLRGYDFPELFEQVAYIRKYLETRSHKQFFLEHRLGINDFRVTLTLSLRNHATAGWHFADDKTPYWLEPRPVRVQNKILEQPIQATVNGRVMGRIPDALFILKPDSDKRHTIAYIYEKDRGTEKHETVLKKLQCYYHWHKEKKHQKALGTKSLRVLIETENESRLKRMITKSALNIDKGKGSGIFWFTTTERIDLNHPESILQPIWTIGHKNLFDPTKTIDQQSKHRLLDFIPPNASR